MVKAIIAILSLLAAGAVPAATEDFTSPVRAPELRSMSGVVAPSLQEALVDRLVGDGSPASAGMAVYGQGRGDLPQVAQAEAAPLPVIHWPLLLAALALAVLMAIPRET